MNGSEKEIAEIKIEMNELKQLLMRTLGEVYRIQQRMQISVPVSDGVVYGLLNGVENAADSILTTDPVTAKESEDAEKFLDEIYRDKAKMAKFEGFYDIERELQGMGIDRGKAIVLLTYLHNSGRFCELTEKMNSSHSPTECKDFELSEFEHGYEKDDS